MKVARQLKIIEIIENNFIETQEELAQALKDSGFTVTQATISRDIKELKLIKVMNYEGKQHYAPLKDIGSIYNERVSAVFRESVLTIDFVDNMIVIRTLPAMAQAAALAIDSMDWSEVVGTIAGDDTIFVLVRNRDLIEEIVGKFKKLMK
ncbi:MAG: transcriptional regulator of arginine metabolism [Eubacteriaceae bacterium]|jgi:transcriptional regulator of arginine metabolism|nr:transcriptional regulator of arginine metabolism [Eubacteriaceae bacterium]MDK2937080.1 transcriptional regulator of arginine metabolism [Eubacteriaceae bacterium]MDN5307673.1 transcriptional regulator of arginine metabolism [Eubacteriaceae bacterium]